MTIQQQAAPHFGANEVAKMAELIPESQRLPEIRARPFDRERDPRSQIENLLSGPHQLEFQRISTVLEYSKTAGMIFAEGEDANFVYTVARGAVRICRHSPAGRRQVLALMFPGDLFGLPEHGIYVNSAEIACPTTLYRVPWHKLRSLMIREPTLQLHLLNRVAHDLREAQRRILTLGQQNTYQRLASFLTDLASRQEFFDSTSGLLTIPLSRFDIGDYLGTTAETVTRGIFRLEQEGLLRRASSRQIEICDLNGLLAMQAGRRRKETQPP